MGPAAQCRAATMARRVRGAWVRAARHPIMYWKPAMVTLGPSVRAAVMSAAMASRLADATSLLVLAAGAIRLARSC